MILITGSSGYIGSFLKQKLDLENIKYIGFDLKEYKDIRKREDLEDVFKNNNIDVVVHLAAYISVPESMEKPLEYYENNTNSMVLLLDIMNKYNCKNIIFSSTANVYKTIDNTVDEESETFINSVYGHSKLLSEQILEQIAPKYNMNYIIYRFFNVAGKKIIGDHLIPMLHNCSKNNKIFNIFGGDYNTADGTCVRDYVSVLDIVEGIYLGIKKLKKEDIYREIINLGSGNGYSVKEIVDIFRKSYPLEYKISPRREGDPPSLTASNEKAFKELGWVTKYNIDDIIKD